MKIVKSIAAAASGLALLFVMQRWVHVPIFPSLSVYPAALLFLGSEDKSSLSISRKLAIVLVTLCGLLLYGAVIYLTIAHYPKYGNFLAVAFDALTFTSFIGAGLLFLTNA